MDEDQAGPSRPTGHASDHLANERTFLAWVRTALGLVGLGFVLARMGLFLRQMAMVGGEPNRPSVRGSHEFLVTGILFLLMGVAVTLASGWLYHRTRRSLDTGRYEPPRHAISALVVVVAAGGLVITALLLWQVLTLGEG